MGVYYFVFGYIFDPRVEGLPDNGFITYLAVGLWPWMTFSEAVLASVNTISNRKDLLGKVRIDLRQVVLAGVTSHFILHGIGFIAVLILLQVLGRLTTDIHLLFLLLPFLIL